MKFHHRLKKMKKYSIVLSLIILLTNGCEKDDFCIEEVTPNLILRFYDVTNPSNTLAADGLTIWPEGRDSIVVNQTLDSIAIPLDVNNEQTIYNFSSGAAIDQITIYYTVNEIFVSRSCGYKAEFSNLLAIPTNSWIEYIEQLTTTFENESAAHIQIYH